MGTDITWLKKGMFIFYFDPVANTSIPEMWVAIPCWIDVLEVCNLSHILKPKRLVFLIITTYKSLCNSFKFVSCHNVVVLCSGQIMEAIISSRLIIVTSTKVLAEIGKEKSVRDATLQIFLPTSLLLASFPGRSRIHYAIKNWRRERHGNEATEIFQLAPGWVLIWVTVDPI